MPGLGINADTEPRNAGNIELPKSQNVQENAPAAIPIVPETKSDKTKESKDNKSLTTELTIENFKESVTQEYSDLNGVKCTFDKVKQTFLLEKFKILISTMSDDTEKAKNFPRILQEFQSKPFLVAEYIKSFKDKDLAMQCADSIDFKILKSFDDLSHIEIVSHMSKENVLKYLKEFNDGFSQYYSEKHEIIEVVLDKISRGEKLVGEEIEVKEALQQFQELRAVIEFGTELNENLSEEDNNDIKNKMEQISAQYPPALNDMYIQSLAEFATKYQDALGFDKEELTKILDKATDNKFSEAMQKLSEQSSVDAETGMLKNKPQEVAAASKERIEALKQEIVLNTPEKETSLPVVEHNDLQQVEIPQETVTGIPLLEALQGINSIKALTDAITGKIKIQSDSEEQEVIKNYKRQNDAMKGQLLKRSKGAISDELIAETDTKTFIDLFAAGWKGKSVFETKKIENLIIERDDDVA
jgi:hypothetical protein